MKLTGINSRSWNRFGKRVSKQSQALTCSVVSSARSIAAAGQAPAPGPPARANPGSDRKPHPPTAHGSDRTDRAPRPEIAWAGVETRSRSGTEPPFCSPGARDGRRARDWEAPRDDLGGKTRRRKGEEEERDLRQGRDWMRARPRRVAESVPGWGPRYMATWRVVLCCACT
jgi:hypothetical protein